MISGTFNFTSARDFSLRANETYERLSNISGTFVLMELKPCVCVCVCAWGSHWPVFKRPLLAAHSHQSVCVRDVNTHSLLQDVSLISQWRRSEISAAHQDLTLPRFTEEQNVTEAVKFSSHQVTFPWMFHHLSVRMNSEPNSACWCQTSKTWRDAGSKTFHSLFKDRWRRWKSEWKLMLKTRLQVWAASFSSVVSDKNRKDDGIKTKPDIYGKTPSPTLSSAPPSTQPAPTANHKAHISSSLLPAPSKPAEGEEFEDSPAPCPDDYAQFCEHGHCEMRHNLPTCR